MDKQQHIHELIDQYLKGELVGQELDKFKIRLKDDPAFLKQVQVQKAIISSIESARKNELKAMLVAAKKKKKGLIIPFGNRSLAVAASILSLLAFGLIIKTMLPQGNSQLSEADKEEPAIVTPSESDQKPVLDSAEFTDNSIKDMPDSTPPPPAPEIAVVEEDAAESVDDESIFTDDTEEVDLAELKKNESDIDGDQFKAQRDSMLGSKTVNLIALSFTKETVEPVETQDVSRNKKEGLFNRKSKDKEESSKAEVATETQKALTATPSGSIRVEFWKSIVNFKGYKFDGSKLLLFDTPVTTPILLKNYNGVTYLNKNGTWFTLTANNSFNQMSRVTNADTLKILNTK